MTEQLNEQNTETDPLNQPQETETTETHPEGKIPYDRFKQKVDEANALKQQLAELEAQKAEEERAKLEQQSEFKTLYEQAQEQINAIKQEALVTKKDALLTKAGYTDEQVKYLRATLVGDTDEELAQAVEDLKIAIAPSKPYIHQTSMPGNPGKPAPKDPANLATTLYERVMKKKK